MIYTIDNRFRKYSLHYGVNYNYNHLNTYSLVVGIHRKCRHMVITNVTKKFMFSGRLFDKNRHANDTFIHSIY